MIRADDWRYLKLETRLATAEAISLVTRRVAISGVCDSAEHIEHYSLSIYISLQQSLVLARCEYEAGGIYSNSRRF